jgi:hypothetical protein
MAGPNPWDDCSSRPAQPDRLDTKVTASALFIAPVPNRHNMMTLMQHRFFLPAFFAFVAARPEEETSGLFNAELLDRI